MSLGLGNPLSVCKSWHFGLWGTCCKFDVSIVSLNGELVTVVCDANQSCLYKFVLSCERG